MLICHRAYPTPYFTVSAPIYWNGLAPLTQDNGVCCWPTVVSSPVPQDHYTFPSSTGSTNSRDPRGWLYVVSTFHIGYTGVQNVSSLLAPATINSVLNYCSVEYPPGESGSCATSTAAAEVSAINEAGGMFYLVPKPWISNKTDIMRRTLDYHRSRH